MSSPLAASTIGRVQPVAFAVPLLPGQAEANRVTLASCWAGARKETYKDARCRADIFCEAVRIQPGPGGDVAVVYLEADDPAIASRPRIASKRCSTQKRFPQRRS